MLKMEEMKTTVFIRRSVVSPFSFPGKEGRKDTKCEMCKLSEIVQVVLAFPFAGKEGRKEGRTQNAKCASPFLQ